MQKSEKKIYSLEQLSIESEIERTNEKKIYIYISRVKTQLCFESKIFINFKCQKLTKAVQRKREKKEKRREKMQRI